MMVIIGVDPHKASHTAVAICGDESEVAKVTVRREPRTYQNSPHSYYADLCRSALPGHPEQRYAQQRLDRYRRELEVERSLGTPEGRRAQRSASTATRESSETPALSHRRQ